jgi:hypothetical protein
VRGPMSSSAEVLVPRQSGSHGLTGVLTVTLALSVTLNVLLARKIQKIDVVRSAKMADRLLKVGERVPPIAARMPDGRPVFRMTTGPRQPFCMSLRLLALGVPAISTTLKYWSTS